MHTSVWRVEWDLNPRNGCPFASFQDWCLKPLGHPPARLSQTADVALEGQGQCQPACLRSPRVITMAVCQTAKGRRVEGALKKVEELLKAGEQFDFDNFALKSPRGYPSHYKPEWVAWRARVSGAISGLFDPASAPMQMVTSATKLQVIGETQDKFELAKSYYMGALIAAKQVLTEDTFGEIIGAPAKGPLARSNRVFVVHGHDDAAKAEL